MQESGLSPLSCDSDHATIQKEKYKHQMAKKSVHWKVTCGQIHIEHLNDMSESEIRSSWYSKAEYKAFKQDCMDTALLARQGNNKKTSVYFALSHLARQGKNLQSTPSSCTRGLEPIISPRRGCLRQEQREQGWDAVLFEQHLQCKAGCCSPRLIANKYQRVSEVCQREASLLGLEYQNETLSR
jgi:hypothetical protein